MQLTFGVVHDVCMKYGRVQAKLVCCGRRSLSSSAGGAAVTALVGSNEASKATFDVDGLDLKAGPGAVVAACSNTGKPTASGDPAALLWRPVCGLPSLDGSEAARLPADCGAIRDVQQDSLLRAVESCW